MEHQGPATRGRPLMGLMSLIFLQAMMGAEPSFATRGCGKQGFLNRIVGGKDSQPGEWPWQVSIKMNGEHHCGGSLITTQWVITASHCFKLFSKPSNFTVVLGAVKLSDPGPHSVTTAVRQIILSPSYDGDLRTGDIALIQMEQPVNLSQRIFPICVPDAGITFPPGHKCWTTGWGEVKARERHQTSDVLQKLEIPIISTNSCNALYHQDSGELKAKRDITNDMICAGFAAGQRDACQGDSGGPLACHMRDSWILAGVVSWGEGCAQKNRPGVYTRVTSYQEWIHTVVPELTFISISSKHHGTTVNNKHSINGASTGSFSLISVILASILFLLA